jgi:integrase
MAKLNKSMARLSSNMLGAILRGTHRAKVKRLHDGGGLYLRLDPGPYWLYRYWHNGAERVMGIGSLAQVGAAEAREKAAEVRKAIRAGGDPQPEQRRDEAKAKALATTFASEAATVLELIKHSTVHPQTKSNAQRAHDEAVAGLGSKPIDHIEVPDVVRLVVPKFEATWDGGHRLRAYIERVVAHAKTHGRSDTNLRNPALTDLIAPALKHLKKPKRKRHNSMPFEQIPDLIARLHRMTSINSQALLMTILSGLRTAEIRRARWPEFDLKDKVWSVPDEHMKMRVAHFVPISAGMASVLDRQRPNRTSDPRVFPPISEKETADTAMLDVLQHQLGYDQYTVHGMRSSLRNWGGKRYSDNVMERVLAHAKGGVEGSYHTDPYFDERIGVMQAWSDYCFSKVPAGRRRHLSTAA